MARQAGANGPAAGRRAVLAAATVTTLAALAGPGTIGAQSVHPVRQTLSHARVAGAPASPVFTLERTDCRGQCGEYKLSFYADGTVIYDGKANVSKAGRWTGRIPPATVDELAGEFRRIGYDTLAATYPQGLAETSVAIVSLHEGDRVKTVRHDVSSPFPPPTLTILEDRIDAAVQSVTWAK